jgi:hypothetical protein
MKNQNKITLCDYLANKVPNDCVEVLMDSGYQFEKPRSREDLADLLKQYVSKDKEKALKKLAEIHPDRELCQSIDRPVMDNDFKGSQTMRMMGQDYANPFFSQYHAENIVRNGQMLNFNGGHSNACGCGSVGFNGFGCNGDKSCGCDCKSKNYNNADGGSSTNNLLYLLLGAGFVWFMINLDNKRSYK